MSSIATAPPPQGAAPDRSRAIRRNGAGGLRLSADAAFGLALAAGLIVLTFVTGGGTDLAPNTWAQIVLVALGAAMAIAVIVIGARGRAWGVGTLVAFAAMTALTAISIAWSVEPNNSWLAANQTLSYIAAFGAALALARLAPERWASLIGAVAVLATVVGAYALLTKVFPGSLDPNDPYGRLRAPFDYSNAIGLMGALGLPACLWAGARREHGRASRALAVPAIAVLVVALVMSYSRGALVAAVVGLACWFALVPLRLRGALVLALGAAGGGAVALWATATDPLIRDYVALPAKTTAGHSFGIVLILAMALLTVAGFVAAFAMDRVLVPDEVRRRIGTALVVLVALIPVAGIGALAASSRGLTGEVSHIWSTLTSTTGTVSNSPGRLVDLSNSRARYWNEAFKVGDHALFKGVGASGYGIARTRYTTDTYPVSYAHGYVVETFADLGLIGLAVNLALLVAWCIAAGRTVGARELLARFRPNPAPSDTDEPRATGAAPATDAPRATDATTTAPDPSTAERSGLLTLLVIVIVFGLHSAIDWTWFIPGTAVPALVCAGWLAGRGPTSQRIGRLRQRRRLTENPGAVAAVVAIAAVALLGAWAVWQPLRSSDAEAAAISASSKGNTAAAIADERAAIARDPVAIDPLIRLAEYYTALGDKRAAHAELLKAVTLQPANYNTWFALGEFDLQVHHLRAAVGALEKAQALNLAEPTVQTELTNARSSLQAALQRRR